jgi:hypothetical protein
LIVADEQNKKRSLVFLTVVFQDKSTVEKLTNAIILLLKPAFCNAGRVSLPMLARIKIRSYSQAFRSDSRRFSVTDHCLANVTAFPAVRLARHGYAEDRHAISSPLSGLFYLGSFRNLGTCLPLAITWCKGSSTTHAANEPLWHTIEEFLKV